MHSFLLPLIGALLLSLPKSYSLVVPTPLYFLQSFVGCVFQAFGEFVQYFLHRSQPPPFASTGFFTARGTGCISRRYAPTLSITHSFTDDILRGTFHACTVSSTILGFQHHPRDKFIKQPHVLLILVANPGQLEGQLCNIYRKLVLNRGTPSMYKG